MARITSRLDEANLQQPSVSIVTPSFNHGQHIEATIKSVLRQDFSDYEHIIIDAGSTDGTQRILAKYQDQYPMRWLSEADNGQVDAISKGFACCRGRIVTWLNSDDVYVGTQVLGRVNELFRQYPELDAVSAGGVEVSTSGQWGRQIPVRQDKYTHRRLCWSDHVLQPATFFRREILSNLSLDTGLDYAFDWDFFIRLADKYNLLAVDEIWAGYRITGSNKTLTGGVKRCRELHIVSQRHTGAASAQSRLISFYCSWLRLASMLPEPAANIMTRYLQIISRVIQVASGYRFTSL